MKTINFATMAPEKECLITYGNVSYWCDAYIILPDGILIGSKNPKDETLVILTKLDSSGLIFTEFNSETTWAEFIELRDEMNAAMESHVHGEEGCSCGEEGCDIVDDEDGLDMEDANFRTELVDLRDYV